MVGIIIPQGIIEVLAVRRIHRRDNRLHAWVGNGCGGHSEVKVTIPEGYNIDQIFALLEEKGVSTVDKLRDAAANHEL